MSNTIVTGANRGIGLEICRQLAARGDDVIAVVRQASDELSALGVRVIDGIDVSSVADAARLAEALEGTRVDVLINNAGVLRRSKLGEIDEASVEEMLLQFRTNALGPLLVTQALLPLMGEGGKVGIVTSRMGSVADNDSGGAYGYRMSKAAVNITGVSLARDLQERGIAVALLHPGYVRTDMTGHSGFVDTDEAAAGLIRRMDELSPATTGTFWHANGETLPW